MIKEQAILNYIIFDLEWNQPFSAEQTIHKPICLHGEIIQIGAVRLDENFQVVDQARWMVKPKYYTRMHWSVSKLTRIKNADLNRGMDFVCAIEEFRQFCGNDFRLLTWGPDDIGILYDNLALHNRKSHWVPGCYDLQMLFDLQIAHKHCQIALETAMELLGEPVLESHDALNDAMNTARICSYLELRYALSHYEEMEQEYLKQTAGADSAFQSAKRYRNVLAALADSHLMEFSCPDCQGKGMCVGAVKQNGNKYIAVGTCENGHEFLARFKFRRGDDRKTQAQRFLYRMDSELRQYYTHCKQKAEHKQKQYLAYLARKKQNKSRT